MVETTVDYLANETVNYAAQTTEKLCQTNTFGTIGQGVSNFLTPISGWYNSVIDSIFPISWKMWILVAFSLLLSYWLTQKFKPSKGILTVVIAAVIYMLLRSAGFGG